MATKTVVFNKTVADPGELGTGQPYYGHTIGDNQLAQYVGEWTGVQTHRAELTCTFAPLDIPSYAIINSVTVKVRCAQSVWYDNEPWRTPVFTVKFGNTSLGSSNVYAEGNVYNSSSEFVTFEKTVSASVADLNAGAKVHIEGETNFGSTAEDSNTSYRLWLDGGELTVDYTVPEIDPILGAQPVGATVKLNINGTPTEFLVINQGLPSSSYDSSCNGTWLLAKNIYEKRAWGGSNNTYTSSDIHTYLNSTFLQLFDPEIQEVIQTAKVPYINGTGSTTSASTGTNGLTAKIFLLSATELGLSNTSYITVCGTAFSYFSSNATRVAYYNGSTSTWYTRSPRRSNTNYVIGVSTSGAISTSTSRTSTTIGVRPALILPSDLEVDANGNVIVNTGGNGSGGGDDSGGGGTTTAPLLYATVNGSLKEICDGSVTIGGVWKPLANILINVNTVWKPLARSVKYTWLEYIESTGTQWIDTGYVPSASQPFGIYADYALTEAQYWKALWGSEATGSGPFSITTLTNASSNITNYVCNSQQIATIESTIGVKATFTGFIDIPNNRFYYGTKNPTSSTTISGSVNTNNSMYIFTLNSSVATAPANQSTKLRLYSYKIFEASNASYSDMKTIQYFHPCINSEGEVGLYEAITGKFFGNIGTGSFIAGPAL